MVEVAHVLVLDEERPRRMLRLYPVHLLDGPPRVPVAGGPDVPDPEFPEEVVPAHDDRDVAAENLRVGMLVRVDA